VGLTQTSFALMWLCVRVCVCVCVCVSYALFDCAGSRRARALDATEQIDLTMESDEDESVKAESPASSSLHKRRAASG